MTDWKDDERRLATHAGGVRMPSNGKVQADVLVPDSQNPIIAFEVKARNIKSFPQWLEHAFDQAELQTRLHRVEHGYVVLSIHYGRGKAIRWFLCREFDPSAKSGFQPTGEDMANHASFIGGLVRALGFDGEAIE